MTITCKAIVDEKGRLTLDVPTDLAPGEVEVGLILPPPAKPKYDFSDLIGKLSYKGDPMTIQREMRDEWPE